MPKSKRVDSASAQIPLRSRYTYSQESFGKYSEPSCRSDYPAGSRCDDCMTRIPYATLIATVMCLIGAVIFCGTIYRGSTLSILMLDEVFHIRLAWLEPLQISFVVFGAAMGALGLMILFVGFLATGATRYKVYRAWNARVGGRISCAVFMSISYILQLGWFALFVFLVIVTTFYTLFWSLCASNRVQVKNQCLDFTQFEFMFPKGVRPEDMEVCPPQEIKLFCRDYVEKAEVMFILATFSCLLIILSLVHFLMCLSANYAHIRDHEKLQELQELNDLGGLAAPKSRF